MSIFERIASELAYLRGALRALRRTTPIAKNPGKTVRELFEDLAREHRDRLAIYSEKESLTYAQLNGRSNQYARWARDEGCGKDAVVALLMPNRPEYLCVWLGIAKAGGVTALLNTNLPGASLAHCINVVGARRIVVDASLLPLFEAARPFLPPEARVFVHGAPAGGDSPVLQRIDARLRDFPDADLSPDERVPLTVNDHCLFIYTSGTTGLPKAANMNHYRVLLAMHGFSGVTGATRDDRMYDVLPMYHSNGGLGGVGAVLTVGGSCFVREKFSAREFWAEATQQQCTIFIYIGELCRYLLAAPPGALDRAHKIRLCFGNGLRPDVFTRFRDRFGIRQITEFYASTEGNITIFNFDSKPGAVGRIPKWMERKFVVKIVRFDMETESPARGPDGRCVECAPDEVGEALGQILNDPARPANRFEGYADREASEKKILRDAFEAGDAWFRSGDLMRKDAHGYFYFIDRIGDTFRWKGENVSTTEVAEALTGFPGVKEATVYGVSVPRMEGRAGMVSLVVEDPATFDLAGLRDLMVARLPDYARPLFIRFQDHIEVTATFKQRKVDLVSEGFDIHKIQDPVFFSDARCGHFTRLDDAIAGDIEAGRIRL